MSWKKYCTGLEPAGRVMHRKVTPVTSLGTKYHENVGKFSELADITAESGVLRSFEWYTTLCIIGLKGDGHPYSVLVFFWTKKKPTLF